MRRIAILALLLAAGSALPGCAWFLFGSVASAVVLTREPEESNSRPAVAIENPVRLKTSPGLVSYRLYDAEGDHCSIAVEVSLAGGPFVPATEGAGGDGSAGLGASPGGDPHVFSWDFASDLASPEQSVRIRFVPSDGGGAGPDAISADFPAGNVPPEVTGLTLPSDPVTGTATLKITVSDTQSDVARIEVQFLRTADAGDWEARGASATPDVTPPELATRNLVTVPGGQEHLFPWDTDAAGNLPGENAPALVRARASEDGVAWGSWFVASGSVDVRNDHPPRCDVPSVRLYQDGLVFVSYTVSDEESHDVSILAEYRPFGETAWRRATPGWGTTPRTFAASPSGAPGIFVWDSLKDRVHTKTVTIRLTPSQGALLGLSAERDVLIGNDQSHGWYTARSMPGARTGYACAACRGRVYVIGGEGASWPYAATSAVDAYDPAANTWSSRAALPVATGGVRAVTLEGKIRVLGGGSTTHHVYDPATDTWTAGPDLPSARTNPGVATANGMVYVSGGDDGVTGITGTLYVFDPVTSTWTSGAALPAVRAQHASAGLGGRIYVVGGVESIASEGETYVYDPASNLWSGGPGISQARQDAGLTVHAGKLVLAGGNYFSGLEAAVPLASTQEYDPFLNAWRSLPNLPLGIRDCGAAAWNGKVYAFGNPDVAVFDAWREISYGRAVISAERGGIAAAEAGGTIYIFGGRDFGTFFANVDAYNPATNAYTPRAALPAARSHAGAALFGGLVYLTGGETADTVEIATVSRYNPGTNAWSAGVALPSKRSRHGCVSMGGRIWCVGGRYWNGSAHQIMTDLTVYDPVAATWSAKAALPAARFEAGCAALGGVLYVAGGEDAGGGVVNTLYAYAADADTWTAKAPMPYAVSGPGAAVVGGRLAVLGGDPGGDTIGTVILYDPDTDAWATGSPLPYQPAQVPAVSWRGRAFLFGGFRDVGSFGFVGWWTSTACYDPGRQYLFANDRDLPAGTAGAAAFVQGGKLHVLGGRNATDAALATHRVLDVAGDVADGQPFALGTPWGTAAALPAAAHGAAALVAGGNAYVIGGLDGSGAGLASFLRYEPATDTWTALPGLSTPRGYLGFAAAAGRLYAFGGESGGIAVNTVEAFDPSTGAWATPAPASMAAARSRFGFASFEGRLFAFGGVGAGAAMLSACERYDPASGAWAALPALPKAMAGALCLEEGGILRLFGGEVRESSTVYRVTDRVLVFDAANGSWARDEETVLPYPARDLFGTYGTASWTHRGQPVVQRLCLLGGGVEATAAKAGAWRFHTRR
jgi:N-acetylneuraminic acid mutarotase